MRFKHHDRGFTWVELMISLAVAAILLTLAIPNFQQDLIKKEVQSSQLKLSRAIQMARQTAMTQANHVVICASQTKNSCTAQSWSQGFLVFIDINNNRKVDSNEQIIWAETLALKYGQLKWGSLNNNNLSFIPRSGLPLGSNGTFSYCAHQSQFSYSLVVSQMGHNRIDRTQRCDS